MISVSNLSLRIANFRLEGVTFEVPSGEYAVLMGRTGSGKTSVLEAICGLRRIQSGRIRLAGRDVTHLRTAERGIAYVPQDGALFSTMTIRDHLAFALRIRKWSRKDIEKRTEELSEMLEIEHLMNRRPVGLSGGEAQRVALGRALAFRSPVLLLDEPLSALDDETRHQTYEILRRVQQTTGLTALHVTHNSSEARALGDRLFKLQDGGIMQSPLPESKREDEVAFQEPA